MKSFHQSTIFQRVDCFLVYTEDQQETFSKSYSNVFTLKSAPKDVAAVLRTANSIYVHPDGFDYWIDVLEVLHKQHPLSIKLFVIAGSDYTIQDQHIEYWTGIFPKAKFWIQNYVGDYPQCRLFPIGVNKSNEMKEHEKTNPLAITFFNPLNSRERSLLDKYLNTREELQKYRFPQMNMEDYLEKLGSSFFSVCPKGNGYDSIRFWESLSVGSIPLVLNNPFVESLMEHHPELPFMILERWEDLPSFLHSDIQKIYDTYMEMSTLDMLTEDYWTDAFERILKTSDQTSHANKKETFSVSEMNEDQKVQLSEQEDHELAQTNPSQSRQEDRQKEDQDHLISQ